MSAAAYFRPEIVTKPRSRQPGRWVVPGFLLASVLFFLLSPLRSASYPDAFEDDFFYYLVAAKHILAGQGSTFDGIHATNGYHPLWMFITVVMAWGFHGRMLFVGFSLLITALILWGYNSTVAVLRQYTTLFAAQCFAAFFALNLTLIGGGMEVYLVVPVLLYLCKYRLLAFRWTPAQAVIYGLLASAAVLARLDCALFVLLLAVLDLSLSSDVPWRERLKAIGPFVLGMVPVLAYLGINQVLFGTAMPVSSHAKQMRLHHTFVQLPIHSLFKLFPEDDTLARPAALAFVLAIGLLCSGPARLARAQRGLIWALLLFMPVHLAILCFSSDWPVWRWYQYPMIACAFGATIVLLTRNGKLFDRLYAHMDILALILCLVPAAGMAYEYHHGRYPFYAGARDVAAFGSTHPGLYAMGDRAGLVGYLLPEPLLQTEGLMMDKPFLENIRQQRELLGVLRSYHIRYFITTSAQPDGSCFLVREPAQGGPDVPVMHGRICSTPVHTFESSDHVTTRIFDLQAR